MKQSFKYKCSKPTTSLASNSYSPCVFNKHSFFPLGVVCPRLPAFVPSYSSAKINAFSTWHFLPVHVFIVIRGPAGLLYELKRQGFKSLPTKDFLQAFPNVCVSDLHFFFDIEERTSELMLRFVSVLLCMFLLTSSLFKCSNTVSPFGNSCAQF